MTQREIAKVMGISYQRVGQIERRAMAKLRKNPDARRLLDTMAKNTGSIAYNEYLARTREIDWTKLEVIPK